jgi:hypothetical protein
MTALSTLDVITGYERYPLYAVRDMLGISNSTIERWAKPPGVRGSVLPTVLVGGRRYVTRQALEAFLNELNGKAGDVRRP